MKPSTRHGFTLIEVMIVVAIIALLAAIAIPNVLRSRTSANESAAVGNLRALVSSLEMARSVNQTYPDVAVTPWLATMYGAGAVPGACAAGVAPDPDFGPPSFCVPMNPSLVQGYNYTYAAGPTAGQTYTIMATPATPGTTGTRSFFVSQTGLIRHCVAAAGVIGTAANGPNWATIDQQPTNPCT